MNPPNISDAEWELMDLLWKAGPLASIDIVERLEERKAWRPRTSRTLLERLLRKKAVRAVHDGRRNLYQAALNMKDCVRAESRSFLDRVFRGEPASMLLQLADEVDLSKDEIKRLKQILDQKEKKS